MKKELLNKFRTLTEIEEQQLEDHLFHQNISNKTLVNKTVTKKLPVLTDKFFDKDIVYIVKQSRFANYPSHIHTFYVINYVISGTITQVVNGNTINLKQGDILLLNVGAEHHVLAPDDNDIMINISLHKDLLNFKFEPDNKPYLLFKKINGEDQMQQVLDMIIEEYFYKDRYSTNNIKDILRVLDRLFKRNSTISFSPEKEKVDKLVQKMLYELSQHYNNISLKMLANKLSYNASYLGTVFKENIGRSFHQVLLDKRLTVAYHDLLFTSLTIDEIYTSVGFTNKTTFYNGFKDKYKQTPNEVRKVQKDSVKFI